MTASSQAPTRPARSPYVQCLHLVKRGHGRRVLLQRAELEVTKGEMVCIVGEMESGKTTLVKLLLGLEVPEGGRITVGGVDPSKLQPREIPSFRRQVGVIFQDLKLMMGRTVYENVSFPLILSERPRPHVHRKTMEALQGLGLERMAPVKCAELSRCEQQLVAIGRATAHEPLILLADEPCQHLDERRTMQAVEHLHAIHTKGTSIIVFTRDRKLPGLLKFARTLFLAQGRFIEEWAPIPSVHGNAESGGIRA